MLTTEQLLIKRYKCIAPIPFQPAKDMYKVGDIFTDDGKTAVRNQHGDPVFAIQWEDYPHLFQPLPWWSDRKISDLPEYVKVTREDCIKDTGLYCKVFRWAPLGDKWPEMKGQVGAELEGYSPLYLGRAELNFPGQVYGRLNATHLLPATLRDYEQYNQQKEGMK